MTVGAPPAKQPFISKVLQRELLAVFGLLFAVYYVLICGFLAVFVPQACPVTIGTGVNATTVTPECTFAENVYIDIGPYNAMVLVINLVTVLLLLAGLAFELARERWIITNFDIDYGKPDEYLSSCLIANPKLEAAFHWWNKTYMAIFGSLFALFLVNAGVSAKLVRASLCPHLWLATQPPPFLSPPFIPSPPSPPSPCRSTTTMRATGPSLPSSPTFSFSLRASPTPSSWPTRATQRTRRSLPTLWRT
jgi:hypothetical protein